MDFSYDFKLNDLILILIQCRHYFVKELYFVVDGLPPRMRTPFNLNARGKRPEVSQW